MPWFTDVILPIPVVQAFTYELTEEEAKSLEVGCRVAVPFGKTKIYTALVYRIHQEPPLRYEAKPIDQILDETPLVTSAQLRHWEWVASYYLCSLGEVFRAAVPQALLLESETLVVRNEAFEHPESELKDDEWLVFEALQYQPVLKVAEVSAIIDRKNVLPVIKRLLEKQVISLHEEVKERYRPKKENFVRLTPEYQDDRALEELLKSLNNRAVKQREVVLHFFKLIASGDDRVRALTLQKESGATLAVIRGLAKKGIFSIQEEQVSRLEQYEDKEKATKQLNPYQKKALEEIATSFEQQRVVLFYGVTSSGKTEVYTKLIEQELAAGKHVMYLVPEIALTTQLIQRLKVYFGEKVLVYHSRYSANERVEVWQNLLKAQNEPRLLVGARSALLLPVGELGLIVIDEEHEPSYKQMDPAPRYHARDAAIVLAAQKNAKVLLGSATPSLESWQNARSGKYGLVTLNRRHGNILMPDMELVDLKDRHRKKRMKGHFSDRMMEEIAACLEEDKQVIIFQNRRGFAPVLECNTCGHSPQCPNCDVSLTYHQLRNELRCHYCGYRIPMQEACMACGSPDTDTKGFGTEQVELELKELFPDARVGRMDSDTTRGKYGFEKIIQKFENRELDILVGTQMVTKGLDFGNVRLVGVLQADSLLHYPDFRAHERCYQLIQQVAGRAGRSGQRGKVVIQSFDPLHRILQQASMNRYEEMAKEQLDDRRQFHYPPFYRLIKVVFKGRDYNRVNEGAAWFATGLRNTFGNTTVEVLGPEFPPVSRVRNHYHKHLMIKIPNDVSLGKVKGVIKKIGKSYEAIANFRSVRIIFNVDNY